MIDLQHCNAIVINVTHIDTVFVVYSKTHRVPVVVEHGHKLARRLEHGHAVIPSTLGDVQVHLRRVKGDGLRAVNESRFVPFGPDAPHRFVVGVEHLNAMIEVVRYVQVSRTVSSDVKRHVEGAQPVPTRTERVEEVERVAIEHFDSVVWTVAHVDFIVDDYDSESLAKLARCVATPRVRGSEKGAVWIELGDTAVLVRYVDVVVLVDGHSARVGEGRAELE